MNMFSSKPQFPQVLTKPDLNKMHMNSKMSLDKFESPSPQEFNKNNLPMSAFRKLSESAIGRKEHEKSMSRMNFNATKIGMPHFNKSAANLSNISE